MGSGGETRSQQEAALNIAFKIAAVNHFYLLVVIPQADQHCAHAGFERPNVGSTFVTLSPHLKQTNKTQSKGAPQTGHQRPFVRGEIDSLWPGEAESITGWRRICSHCICDVSCSQNGCPPSFFFPLQFLAREGVESGVGSSSQPFTRAASSCFGGLYSLLVTEHDHYLLLCVLQSSRHIKVLSRTHW